MAGQPLDALFGIHAQALARNRVELLRSRACPAPDDGDARAARGMREFWRVSVSGQLRVIADSVEFTLPRGRAHVVYRAWTVCAAATPAPAAPSVTPAPAASAAPAGP